MPGIINSMPPAGGNFSGGLRDSYGSPVANPTPSSTPYTPLPGLGQSSAGIPQQSTAAPIRSSAPMASGQQGQAMMGAGGVSHAMPGYSTDGSVDTFNPGGQAQSLYPTMQPNGNTGSISGVMTGASSVAPRQAATPGLGQLASAGGSPLRVNQYSGSPGGGGMSPGPVAATSPMSSPATSAAPGLGAQSSTPGPVQASSSMPSAPASSSSATSYNGLAASVTPHSAAGGDMATGGMTPQQQTGAANAAAAQIGVNPNRPTSNAQFLSQMQANNPGYYTYGQAFGGAPSAGPGNTNYSQGPTPMYQGGLGMQGGPGLSGVFNNPNPNIQQFRQSGLTSY